MLDSVNWLAVLVAGIAFFMLGGVWYSAIFGRTWARLVNIDWENPGGNMAVIFGLTFVLELLAATVMAILLHQCGFSTAMGGIHLGLVVGLGIVTPVIAINNLYQRKSVGLTAIDAGHMTLGLILVGAIVGAWR